MMPIDVNHILILREYTVHHIQLLLLLGSDRIATLCDDSIQQGGQCKGGQCKGGQCRTYA
jgi:hypothetical protein